MEPVFQYNLYNFYLKRLLLLIFLPALIFESAFKMSFHMFRRELPKSLLLAGPGVIISALLTATVFLYVL